MSDFGFVGPTYVAASPYVNSEECINFRTEIDITKQAGQNGVVALYPTPGLTTKAVLSRRVLTNEQVLEIRQKLGYRKIAMLSREYKVGESTIRRIRDGERYGDIR